RHTRCGVVNTGLVNLYYRLRGRALDPAGGGRPLQAETAAEWSFQARVAQGGDDLLFDIVGDRGVEPAIGAEDIGQIAAQELQQVILPGRQIQDDAARSEHAVLAGGPHVQVVEVVEDIELPGAGGHLDVAAEIGGIAADLAQVL